MPRSASRVAVAVVSLMLFSCAFSCAKAPPAEPEYDPFEAMEEQKPVAEPEPEPEPKCESFDEGCRAARRTWLSFGDSATFQPPRTWLYAKLAEVSVAKHESNDAALGFRVVSAPLEPKKNPNSVIAAVGPLFDAMSVEVAPSTMRTELRKNGIVDDSGSISLSTWELNGKVGGAKTAVLLILASLGSGEGLVGVVAINDAVFDEYFEVVRQSYRSVRSAQ